jgi:zinc transporter ZupT
MSQAGNNQPGEIDRALLKSSQILTRTFHKGNEHNPDMDLLVNPSKSDMNKMRASHTHDDTQVDNKKLSNATPYLLLVALCLDGFFEGIALGLQNTWNNVLFVACAIIVNKISVALSLGLSFKKSETDIQTFIRFILLFSMFCPFGIVLGYFSITNELAKGVLLSFASGTFIYVSCSVNIVEEFALTRYKYSKYIFFLLGGLATAGISILGVDN